VAFFRKIKAGLVKNEIETFIGEEGNIFFNVDTGELRLSDGSTPGGVPIGGNSVTTISNTEPQDPSNGTIWYNPDTNELSIYYDDGSAPDWFTVGGGDGSGPRGFTGSAGIGYTGSQGSIGYTGSQGESGVGITDISSNEDGTLTLSYGVENTHVTGNLKGNKGDKGDQGNKGDIGYTGSQGVTGFTGSKGDDGYVGADGYTGSQGETGFTGSRGDVGYTGSLGDPGIVVQPTPPEDTSVLWLDTSSEGFIGSQGGSGYTGSQGFTGSAGTNGYTGSSGYTGSAGTNGYTGSSGYTGSAGTNGFVGSQGDIGFTGSLGYTGSAGTTDYNQLTNTPTIYSSAYIGTTSLDFTRASASQTLNGVSIDGSVLWTNSSPAPGTPYQTNISGASGNATILLRSGLPNLGSSVSWTFDETKITFPDTTTQTTAWTGNASTVTNGVYTTDTGTVTNTMLAGSIANNKLANSSITINGSSTALGGSVTISTITGNAGTATKLATARAINGVDFDGSAAITVTAAAGTLTGTTLNSSVVSSSLTSVGTLNGVTSNAATAFIAGTAAESGVALQMPREGALRNLYNGANNNMYFDVSIGGTAQGQFQFRSSNAFTNVLTMSPTAFNVNPDAVVTARTPSFGRLPWNSAIDTELTIDDYRFRVSNQGGIFPQVISNTGGTKNSAWTVVAARSGSAITQTGSTGMLVPNNAWTSLYTSGGMDSAGDTYVATLQDKNQGRIYRITFMRSDNGSTTGYNIIAERLL
jgi:hypothetical protein